MKPYLLARDEGEAYWMFDALDTVKAGTDQTGGGLAVVEFLDFEGSSVPLHVNDRWDRGFYILDCLHWTITLGARRSSTLAERCRRARRDRSRLARRGDRESRRQR